MSIITTIMTMMTRNAAVAMSITTITMTTMKRMNAAAAMSITTIIMTTMTRNAAAAAVMSIITMRQRPSIPARRPEFT